MRRLFAKLTAKRLGAAVALLAMAALAALLVSREHAAETSATFCTERCHTEPHPGHRELACQSCHAVSPGLARSLAWNAALGARMPPHGAVDDAACRGCHAAKLVASEGHRVHATGKTAAACVSCHGAAGVSETACTQCHEDARLHHGKTDERCTSCHAFGLTAAPSTVQGCAGCHGENAGASFVVGESVLHGEVDCASCHSPHPARHAENVRGLDCSRCHQIDALGEGPAGHQKCEGCHAPHARERDAVASCASCHGEKVRGSTTALKHDDCSSCHLPHRWVAARAGCYQCHTEKVTQLAANAPAAHARCESCHAPHAPPPTATTCTGCHRPLQTMKPPSGHQQCTGCHDPHGGAAAARDACKRCHAPVAREILATKLDGHIRGGCRSCHNAHGAPTVAQARCESCHRGESRAAARAEPDEHRRCSSCHRSHRFAIAAGQTDRACASCHETLVMTRKVHAGDCQRCHTPHGSPVVTATACADCHRDVDAVAVRKQGHRACDGCHAPHTPAAEAARRCSQCHTSQALAATSWPRASPHEASCTSCHRGHDVDKRAQCASCHVNEAQQRTKHQCTQCHAPHRAAPSAVERQKGGWWLRCSGCHTSEASATAERGPNHSRCANCHTPHRSEVKACTSCHRDMAKSALHARAEHRADCKSCHATHEKSNIDRAACLSCHRDKKTHRPESPRCQVCHLFAL